jgi:hypothetical protein
MRRALDFFNFRMASFLRPAGGTGDRTDSVSCFLPLVHKAAELGLQSTGVVVIPPPFTEDLAFGSALVAHATSRRVSRARLHWRHSVEWAESSLGQWGDLEKMDLEKIYVGSGYILQTCRYLSLRLLNSARTTRSN